MAQEQDPEHREALSRALRSLKNGDGALYEPKDYFAFWGRCMSSESHICSFLKELVKALIDVETVLSHKYMPSARGSKLGTKRSADNSTKSHVKQSADMLKASGKVSTILQYIVVSISYIDLTVQHISHDLVHELCEQWQSHRMNNECNQRSASQDEGCIWREAAYVMQLFARRRKQGSQTFLLAKDLVIRCVAPSGHDEDKYLPTSIHASNIHFDWSSKKGESTEKDGILDSSKQVNFPDDSYTSATVSRYPSLGNLAGNSTFRAYEKAMTMHSDSAYTYACLKRSITNTGTRGDYFSSNSLTMRLNNGNPPDSARKTASKAFEILLSLASPLQTQLAMELATERTMTQALSVMMLMYNMLSLHPAVLTKYLDKAAIALEPISTWPSPYGDVALMLTSALNIERKAPGTAMWKRVLGDIPVLTHHGQYISDVCMESMEGMLSKKKKSGEKSMSPAKEAPASPRNTLSADSGSVHKESITSSVDELDNLEARLRTSIRVSIAGYSPSPVSSPNRTHAKGQKNSHGADHTQPDFNPLIINTQSERDVLNPLSDLHAASRRRSGSDSQPRSKSTSHESHKHHGRIRSATHSISFNNNTFNPNLRSLRWSSAIRGRKLSSETNISSASDRSNLSLSEAGAQRLLCRSSPSLSEDIHNIMKDVNEEELELIQAVRCWELISSSCFVYLASERENPLAWLYAYMWESQQKEDADTQETLHQMKIDKVRRDLLMSTLAWDLDLSEFIHANETDCGMPDDPLGLANAPQEVVRQWFATARQCLAQASRMPSVEKAHEYRVGILSQLLRQIVDKSNATIFLKPATGAPSGVNQVNPGGGLSKVATAESMKKDKDSKQNMDPDLFCGREFIPQYHETAVELQFRPMLDLCNLERIDTIILKDSTSLPATNDMRCLPEVSGGRRYLKYSPGFDDMEDIALSARMPSDTIEDMAAFMELSTPTKSKISQLQGSASTFLAEAEHRLSIQRSGRKKSQNKSNVESKAIEQRYSHSQRQKRRSILLHEVEPESMPEINRRRLSISSNIMGKTPSLESLVMDSGRKRGKKLQRRLSVRKSISAWSDPVGYNLSSPLSFNGEPAGVAREMEIQRRAHYALASGVQKRFAFDGHHMTMGIDEVHNSVMRMAVLGDVRMLHRIVCGFVAMHNLHKNDTLWLHTVDFRIYIVPVGHSDLAAYLGEHDSWYSRHLFCPFLKPLVSIPRLSVLSAGTQSGIGEHDVPTSASQEYPNHGPHSILPTLFQSYITEAHQVLPVAIFDCECWFPSGIHVKNSKKRKEVFSDNDDARGSSRMSTDTPHVTIPFCSRMTIGLHTNMELHAKHSGSDPSDILTSKSFSSTQRSQTENLDINYVEVGLDGIEQDPQSISGSFHVVAAMNLPAYKTSHKVHELVPQLDPAFPMHALPDPTSHTLDICLIGGQGSAHDMLKRTSLRREDMKGLHDAMRADMSQVRSSFSFELVYEIHSQSSTILQLDLFPFFVYRSQ